MPCSIQPTALLLAALIPLAACGGDDDAEAMANAGVASTPAVPVAADVLVPTDAGLLIRVDSFDRLANTMGALRESTGAVGESNEADTFLALLGLDSAHLDLGKPMYIAATFGSGVPSNVLVLPVSDEAAFRAAHPSDFIKSSGGYFGLSATGEYVAGSNELLKDFPTGSVAAVRADIEAINTAFGPAIDMGLDQMEDQMARMPVEQTAGVDMAVMGEMYRMGLDAFFDSCDVVEMRLDYALGLVSYDMTMHTKEGMSMASWSSDRKVDFTKVLGRAGNPRASIRVLMGADYANTVTSSKRSRRSIPTSGATCLAR